MEPRFGTVALVAANRDSSIPVLKRAALLFDQIVPVTRWTVAAGKRKRRRVLHASTRLLAELEWLTKVGVVTHSATDIPPGDLESLHDDPDNPRRRADTPGEFWHLAMSRDFRVDWLASDDPVFDLRWMAFIPHVAAEAVTVFARGTAHPPVVLKAEESDTKRQFSVAELVFRNVPQPSDSTPWEDVLEWRVDPEAQAARRRLRRWWRDAITSHEPRHVIEDELQYLIDEYEAHMRLHRMKINQGLARSFVVMGAGMAEDVVKFKWRQAAESLFVLKERRIRLLEAERSAPGREIAYLVSVRERFR